MSNVPNNPGASQRQPLGRKAPSVPTLKVRVAELEHQMAAMTAEVRTRRLVVVDELGRERITAETTDVDADDAAELSISSADELSRLTLTQFTGGDDGEAATSLMATAKGDTTYAMLSTTDGHEVRVSFDVDEPETRRRLIDARWRGASAARRPRSTPELGASTLADAEQLLRQVHDVVIRHRALNRRLEYEAGRGNDVTDEAYQESGSSRIFDLLLLMQELIQRLDTGSQMHEADFVPAMVREGLM